MLAVIHLLFVLLAYPSVLFWATQMHITEAVNIDGFCAVRIWFVLKSYWAAEAVFPLFVFLCLKENGFGQEGFLSN